MRDERGERGRKKERKKRQKIGREREREREFYVFLLTFKMYSSNQIRWFQVYVTPFDLLITLNDRKELEIKKGSLQMDDFIIYSLV